MQGSLVQFFADLYADYIYVTEALTTPEKTEFHDIFFRKVAIDPKTVLFKLSKYLKIYTNMQLKNSNKCIILIDEYDCPMNNAYQNGYFKEANAFFGTLYSSLLKVRAITIEVVHGNDANKYLQNRTMRTFPRPSSLV